MNLDEIQRRSRELFRQEASELLSELEAALLELEAAPTDLALINRVFRAMHTLKGSGATSGFTHLSQFLHHVEDVYDAARENKLTITPAIIDLTLKIGDAIARYLAATEADAPTVLASAQPHLDALLTHLPAKLSPKKRAEKATATQSVDHNHYEITFRPHSHIFRTGTDPALFLDDLRQMGTTKIQGCTDRLPKLAKLDPESCYLHWQIDLQTSASIAQVREVFAFIEDDCDLKITSVEDSPTTTSGAPTPTATTAPGANAGNWHIDFQITPALLGSPGAVDSLWLELGKLGTHQILAAPGGPQSTDKYQAGTWSISLASSANENQICDAFAFTLDANPQIRKITPADPAPREANREKEPPTSKTGTSPRNDLLRVSADKIDRLVNLVGELVILRSQVSTACASLPQVPPTLQGAAEGLLRLSGELRDVVLTVRMMPIGESFNKFKRLVRDLSRDLGKEVEISIEGAATEMDKTMLDQLNDPLVHLVRNALDHGLETPEERLRHGKSRHGTLRLKAEQRGDRVWISVADDGRGLDAEKIRLKAIAQGLITATSTLTDTEAYQLVFLPGFSTADAVSEISGRGVGMDVVKKRIEALRGTVELRSTPGAGTDVRLSLPLTLAIIDGLMVEMDEDRYILPLAIVRETIELTRHQRQQSNGRNVVELRRELIPYVRLRDSFELDNATPDIERVVIVELEGRRLGIVVDRVLGNHQTVLKSLGWLSSKIRVFSGATVLGDGRIALILDVPNLLAHHSARQPAACGLEI